MKHKKVGARLLSALMTLTLVLGVLPATAWAEEVAPAEVIEETTEAPAEESEAEEPEAEAPAEESKAIATFAEDSSADSQIETKIFSKRSFRLKVTDTAENIAKLPEGSDITKNTVEDENISEDVKKRIKDFIDTSYTYDGDLNYSVMNFSLDDDSTSVDLPKTATLELGMTYNSTLDVIPTVLCFDDNTIKVLETTDGEVKSEAGGYVVKWYDFQTETLSNIVTVTNELTPKEPSSTKETKTFSKNSYRLKVTDTSENLSTIPEGSSIYKTTIKSVPEDVSQRIKDFIDASYTYEGDLTYAVADFTVGTSKTAPVDLPETATLELGMTYNSTSSEIPTVLCVDDDTIKVLETTDGEVASDAGGIVVKWYDFQTKSLSNIVTVTTKLTAKGDPSVLPSNLEKGKTYTVTANMYVPGDKNEVLTGTTAYLTNTNLPPLDPVEKNAKLNIDENGVATLTINQLNSIFSLQGIEGSDTVDIAEEGKIWKASSSYGEHGGRIAGLVMTLKDYNGHYTFTNCKEYAVILPEGQRDKTMPIEMDVDFSSATLTFNENADVTEKEFTDSETESTITVRTSESSIAEKLSDATLSVTKSSDAAIKKALRKEYPEEIEYKAYQYDLKASDGTTISLSDNSQVIISIKNDYEKVTVYQIIDGVPNKVQAVSIEGMLSFTVDTLNPIAIVDNDISKYWSHKDYNGDDISYSMWIKKETAEEEYLNGIKLQTPKKETAENGTKYYIAFKYALGGDTPHAWWNQELCELTMQLPASEIEGKNIYLVKEHGDEVYLAQASSAIEDGVAYITLMARDQFDSMQGVIMMSSMYNGWVGTTEGNEYSEAGNAYILITDAKYAGMPEPAYDVGGKVLDSFTYMGYEQTGYFLGSNSKVTESSNCGVNAGTYTFKVVPQDGYTWLDGTTTEKEYTWYINKRLLGVSCEDKAIHLNDPVPDIKLTITGTFIGDDTFESEGGKLPAVTVFLPDTETRMPLSEAMAQKKLEVGKQYSIFGNVFGDELKNYRYTTDRYGKLTVLPDDIAIIEKPTAATGLVANGSTLTGVPAGEGYTVENGTGSAAGNYTATVTLKEGYYWSDGTRDELSIPWTIAEKQNGGGNSGSKEETKTVTANLYLDGKYNQVLKDVTVYLNNSDNPLDGSGAPTVPMADNATLVTKNGKKLLTLDITNPVFTLQSIGGCSNASVVSTETSKDLIYPSGADKKYTSRISKVTFELKDDSGEYVFTNCEEYPTALAAVANLNKAWTSPLVLKVKFDGGVDSSLDSNKNVDTSGITGGGGGSSNETTADITVKVSGDTATVSKINTKDVSEKNDLVLNVTDGAKDVTGAKLPVSDLKTIADAKVPNTTVKLSDASVSLDLNALKAALKAAKGSTLDIRVLTGSAAEKKLSDAQKSALGDAKNGAAVYVEISSNGKAITDLATGKLTVTAPYQWDGKGSVQAWQMDENGKLTSVPVSCKDNVATLILTAPGAILLGTTDAQVDTETKTFADVPANAYYKKAVDWAVENGITSGTSETTFAPDATCTRAQTVTFLWRAAGSPEPTKQDNPFTDVKADAYYYKAVLWAVENGITSGTTATTFAPDATVSRAQVVSFQYRLAGAPKAEGTNVFTDVPANAYYRDAVLWAAQNGITSGTTATTFAPNVGCTRSQIVTFLYRQLANK